MGLFDRLFQSEKTKAGWPTIQGEISEMNICHTAEGLAAEINYSYCANGEYYSGTFQKKFPPFSSESEANAYIARFENVSKIPVHYHPDKPEISAVIEDELN
jgi:hypothetical protein